MAKFLTISGNIHIIEEIIIQANTTLVLVTPFLRLDQNFTERLKDADKRGMNITLIYGKDELRFEERKKLDTLENLEIYFCENLHAKCYHNENQMIISSMNLYEYSKNNREMGILIEKSIDKEIFEDTIKEINSIQNASILKKNRIAKPIQIEKMNIRNRNEARENPINNFLLTLHQLLHTELEGYQIELKESEIIIEDYPMKDMKVVVSGRIDFRYAEHLNYARIQGRNEWKLNQLYPNLRFYWNYFMTNIYMEKNYQDDPTPKGIELKAQKYLDIILNIGKAIAKN